MPIGMPSRSKNGGTSTDGAVLQRLDDQREHRAEQDNNANTVKITLLARNAP